MNAVLEEKENVVVDYPARIDAIERQLKPLGMVLTSNRILNAILKTHGGADDVVIDYLYEHNDEVLDEEALSAMLNPDDGADVKMDDEDREKEIARKRDLQKQRAARERKRRMMELGPSPRLSRTVSDSQIHQIVDGEEALEAISMMFDHNFFVVLIHYILKQLLNSTQNCMICGQQLEYPGLKPTICLSPFCQFRLLEIGLGGGSDGSYGLGAEILGHLTVYFFVCF